MFQTAQAHVQLFEKFVKSFKSNMEEVGINGQPCDLSPESWTSIVGELENMLQCANNVSSSLSHCLTVFVQQEEVSVLLETLEYYRNFPLYNGVTVICFS